MFMRSVLRLCRAAKGRSRRRLAAAQAASALHSVAAEPPQLPADVLEIIARATLLAEGGDVHAWARLSLVNSVFRDALHGAIG